MEDAVFRGSPYCFYTLYYMWQAMSRWLALALLSLTTLSAWAQRPAFGKMSPLVRQAWLAQQRMVNKTKAKAVAKANVRSERTIMAFVKLASADSSPLTEQGAQVLAQKGGLFVANIPLGSLAPLSCDERVVRIEAGQRATTHMDTTAVVVNATSAQQLLRLPQAYTGRGVVVGVQDIGFDLTHPNFFSPDMAQYRIKALWDQLAIDTLQSSLPVGRDYVGRDSLLALGCPRDGLKQTHGTHTAGIAAGSGAEGADTLSPYRGIAWESDICLVCNATTDDIALINPDDYYKYTYALDALGFKYIFDYADRVGKPCVINFSEGSRQDFQGYDVLYYEMLDSLVGPGHIIVSSAGNDGQAINYLHKAPSQQSAGLFCGSNLQNVGFTTKATADFTLRLSVYSQADAPQVIDVPMSKVLATSDSTLVDTVAVGDYKYVVSATAYPSCYNADEVVCDWDVITLAHIFSKCYPVAVQLVGQGADVELFPVTGWLYHSSVDNSLADGDNSHSINSPSSAPAVICVGATGYRTQFINYLGQQKVYDNGQGGARTPFSGVGPTFDGRVKPDVMAPGQNIISSYSSFYLENNPDAGDINSDVRHFSHKGRTYAWNSNAGTSMSSPVVAGAIALWLQADPSLSPSDCLSIFEKTCRRYDPMLSYPNNLYGYGEIDVTAGLEEVLRRQAAGVQSVPVQQATGRIYTLDGRGVGTDASALAPGLYIRDGRKFVVPSSNIHLNHP